MKVLGLITTLLVVQSINSEFCDVGQTEISSRWLMTTEKSCNGLITGTTDFYNKDFRYECQNALGLSTLPHTIEKSSVIDCFKLQNDTRTFRAKICCQGLAEHRCYTCDNTDMQISDLNNKYYTDRCDFYENNGIKTCSKEQVCRTTYDYGVYDDQGGMKVTKSCMDKRTCAALASKNGVKCSVDSTHPMCTSCCDGPLCNRELNIRYIQPKSEDICKTVNCKHGGTCVAKGETFECKCVSPYTGTYCMENVCSADRPCGSRGQCVTISKAPYYRCSCKIDYIGPTCELANARCGSAYNTYCQNGGECYKRDDTVAPVACKCKNGFVGKRCEFKRPIACGDPKRYMNPAPITILSPNPTNCGKLTEQAGSKVDSYRYLRLCKRFMKSKYHNKLFEDGVDGQVASVESVNLDKCERGEEYTWLNYGICCPACHSAPCQNGGYCVADGLDYVCQCRFGFAGNNCETEVATCYVSGDPHYRTFDGEMIHFQGTCKYEMASTKLADGSKLTPFRVLNSNEYRYGMTSAAYPKYVEVEVYGHVIRMGRQNVLTIDGEVMTPNVYYPGFSVIMNGKSLRLETDFSLIVENDGHWIATVQIPNAYKKQMLGICANADNDKSNDLETKDGVDVSRSEYRFSKVGNSWQVPDDEQPSCQGIERKVPKDCVSPMKEKVDTVQYCGALKDKTYFKDCLAVISQSTLNEYLGNCHFDVCANQDDKVAAKKASCASLTALAFVCSSLGKPVDYRYRSAFNCPMQCPTGMHYKSDASACQPTCSKPKADKSCALKPQENCVCSMGQLLLNGVCVPESSCGCTDDMKNEHKIGDVWRNADCSIEYTCKRCSGHSCVGSAKITQKNVHCSVTSKCIKAKYGYGECKEENPCADNDCKHGTCVPKGTSYTCKCSTGYGGKFCDIDVDNCSSSPCLNGGTCSSSSSGYTCKCPSRYVGKRCEEEFFPCDDLPCKHGATCRNTPDGYDCTCTDGYTGKNCNEKTDKCASNPCANDGECKNVGDSYVCACKVDNGYEGPRCRKDVNECKAHPCQNGATCHNTKGSFTCNCKNGFDGKLCETDKDECASNPCAHGGTCTDKVNGYTCACKDGYNGPNCNGDQDECKSNPCKNNGVCHNLLNAYKCVCEKGYTGLNCGIDINECESNPCLHGGVCDDQVNGYNCDCKSDYDGRICEIDMNKCRSNPCKHGATCKNFADGFKCECSKGYKGPLCSTDINECLKNNPCHNGGVCLNLSGSFKCKCKSGYAGRLCATDVDECSTKNKPSHCVHGTCKNTKGTYECDCNGGYYGKKCDKDIDECKSAPCSNGGTCNNLPNKFKCTCKPGYTGVTCNGDTNECLSDPCQNGGTCKNKLNAYTCACKAGYYGVNCQNKINKCDSNPCENGATCENKVNAFKCKCTSNYEGKRCEIDVNSCRSSPCKNGGTCDNTYGSYTCTCRPTYKGKNCNVDVNECDHKDLCLNGGTCTNLPGNFKCACVAGYTGKICQTDVNECNKHPCKNGATCYNNQGSFACVCKLGYKGPLCKKDIDECKTASYCKYGTCTNLPGTYKCHCDAGYTGVHCDVVIDTCESAPCHNGATCKSKKGGKFECLCKSGFKGLTCDKDVNECKNKHICKNEGSCINNKGSYICRCKTGYTGKHCETKLKGQCESNPCKNGATCNDDTPSGSYTCKCKPGFTGRTCDQDVNECKNKNICKNEGSCINTKGSYVCRCKAGYTGTHCDKDINECYKHPCKNGATCHNTQGSFTCVCKLGYKGPLCKKDIDECKTASYCKYGTCTNLPGTYKCHCDAGYTGVHCDVVIDTCESAPCHNGATCKSKKGGKFECLCKSGFKGLTCDKDVNECKNKHICKNEGSCINTKGSYVCRCKTGYTGKHCETKLKGQCESNPCKNGATCNDDTPSGSYTCKCKSGFTGRTCDQDVNECKNKHICKNEGSCINTKGSYVCRCKAGYTGKHCDKDINECNKHPCKNGATCHNNQGSFTCVCKLGYKGKYCKKDIDECKTASYCKYGTCTNLPGTYKCHCDAGYTGVHCDVVIDTCESAPCHNGATCKSKKGGKFECLCKSGFKGLTCDKDVNECKNKHICKNEGSCINTKGSYVCRCKTGYTGKHCETKLKGQCESNPCKNGATCNDDTPSGHYTCKCKSGFTGRTCDQDVNECKNKHICKNEGSCINTKGSYVCRCKTGYTGKHCETKLKGQCESNPCKNGATCNDDTPSGHYTCKCKSGFTGRTCDQDIDECKEQVGICRNGGTCLNTRGSYTCKCDNNHSGKHCTDVISKACNSSPCQNGGTCKNTGSGYRCKCASGYDGKNCEQEDNGKPQWTTWSKWGDCSEGCGKGTQQRHRRCNQHGSSSKCTGSSTETRACKCENNFDPQVDCERCTFTSNGAGYLADKCDCSKYYQCQKNGKKWISYHRSCAACLNWSQSSLTCSIRIDEAKCQVTTTPHESTKKPKCDLKPVKGDDTKYRQDDYIMNCAPGTIFKLAACRCVTGTSTNPTTTVKPSNGPKELTCMNFQTGWNGFGATHGIYVQARHVKLQKGTRFGQSARFNGRSSILELPRFTNTYHNFAQLTISLWYKRDSDARGSLGLVDNGNCEIDPSILMSSDDGSAGGQVITDKGNARKTGIPVKQNEWNHIALVYRDTTLSIYINGVETTVGKLTGNVKESKCPLVIGHSTKTGGYFKGLIDNLCIYDTGLTTEQVQKLYNKP